MKKNPSLKMRASKSNAKRARTFPGSRAGADYSVQVKRAGQWVTLAQFRSQALAVDYGQALAGKYKRAELRVYWPDSLKKNPAPREASAEPEVTAAAKLFQDFTGHRATRAKRVEIPRHRAAMAVGRLLAVAYATTRDGRAEKYLHEFRSGARPTLAASSDGRQLYLLGGAYRFTERGIVDK